MGSALRNTPARQFAQNHISRHIIRSNQDCGAHITKGLPGENTAILRLHKQVPPGSIFMYSITMGKGLASDG